MRHEAEVKKKVSELYIAGTPRTQIAKDLNIPRTTIYNWTKGVLVVVCKACGKQFERRRVDQRYCSRECKEKAKYRRGQERKRKARPLRSCPVCEKSFHPRNDKNHQYCSYKCKDTAAKRRKRAKKKNGG